MHISHNTELTKDGLFINGSRDELKHSENFKTFIFNTSSAVCAILAQVFPNPVAIPGKNGTAISSDLEAWIHYNDNSLLLQTLEIDSPEFVNTGKILLQWCFSAYIAAKITNNEVMNQDDFLPVQFIAFDGGAALSCSPNEWNEHLAWELRRYTIAGAITALEGDAEKDPRPHAISVKVPWPEFLGADLGGPDKIFENSLSIASDISCTRSAPAYLYVGRNVIVCDMASIFIDEFEKDNDDDKKDLCQKSINIKIVDREFFLRSTRIKNATGEFSYNLRIYETTKRHSYISELLTS